MVTIKKLIFKLMKEDPAETLGHRFFGSGACFAMPMAAASGNRRYPKPVQTMANLQNRIRKYGAGGFASDENLWAACR